MWLGVIFILHHGNSQAAEIYSTQSGNWGSTTTWTGGEIPTVSDNVTILSGHIVVVESSGKSCLDLTVETGGKLFTNSTSTGGYPRYIYVYGNIHCHGEIGNGTTYDRLGFNIEGASCSISGGGTFDAACIRKYKNINDTTTVTFGMNLILTYGGTALYNNKSGTVLAVVVGSGYTVSVPGNGIVSGNIAIDGTNGAGSYTGGGSVAVEGTLIISGILYLTTNNSGNPVSVSISGTGIIETGSISCPNSGASGHTFTIADGGSLNLTDGDWGEIGFANNTYTFHPGSTVIYSGTSAQTVGNPTNYHHLVLSGNGLKTISSDMVCEGDLTIEPNAVLEVGAGISLSVSGDCVLGGDECLVLKSPADSGASASFIPEGTISGTGTAVVERFIKKYLDPEDDRYHMLSSPVSSQAIQPEFVEDPPEAGVDFYRWGETSGVWVNCKDISGGWDPSFQAGDDRTFIPGRGYLVAYPGDVLKSFTGSLNLGDLLPDITYNEGDYAGFNLVGNPYSSALDGEIQNWVKSSVDNAIWVWDGEAGNYRSWNGSVGSLADGIIPAMQAFFVHANDADPALTIPTSSRVHVSQSFYKTIPENILHITVSQRELEDGVVIGFNSEALPGPDPTFDVIKMFGSIQAPQLFCRVDKQPLSVDIRPYPGSGFIIPMGFIAGTSGEHQMTTEGAVSFSPEVNIFLEDKLEDQVINLKTTGKYSFFAEEGPHPDRFFIRFGQPADISEKEDVQLLSITSKDNFLIINGLTNYQSDHTLRVFDLSGRIQMVKKVNQESQIIKTTLPTGFYLVQLMSGGEIYRTKIYINNPNN